MGSEMDAIDNWRRTNTDRLSAFEGFVVFKVRYHLYVIRSCLETQYSEGMRL